MMEDLKKALNDYFDRTSEEQFLKDIEDAGCSHMIEDIEVSELIGGVHGMKEDCSLCGVTFQSDVPANVCPDCEEGEQKDE
jgi:rubrerythrin